MSEQRLQKCRDAYKKGNSITFRGIPIHTCEKIPYPYDMIGIDLIFIQKGACPF